MRYLKEYNTWPIIDLDCFNLSEFEDIMDVFQDVIDEYDLISSSGNTDNDNVDSSYDCLSAYNKVTSEIIGNTYDRIVSTLIQKINQNMIIIHIYSPIKNGDIVPFLNEEALSNDVNKFIDRLKIIGYSIKKDYLYDYTFITGKKVEFIDTITIEIKKI